MQPSLPIAASVLAATVDDLRPHAPFDRMEQAHLEWAVARLSVVYFAPDEVVLAPEDAVPQHLYIVKQGGVAGLGPEDPPDAPLRWRLSPGECFPLGALLGKRPVTSLYRACGDTFCYRLAAADFRRLLELSAPFRDFASLRLASMSPQSWRGSQTREGPEISVAPLDRPLRAVLRRPLVACRETTPLREVLDTMRRERVGSMLVTAADGTPVGIFTLHDLRDRVMLERIDATQPIGNVMTPDPVQLLATAMAFEAALVMARHGFHHIVVTDDGRAVGVVSESDLFAVQRVGMNRISVAIRQAAGLPQLQQAGADIRALARNLLAQGVSAEQLTRIVSTLNDVLTARVVELEASAAGMAMDRFCWLALGSEGRHEQTLATDQDNAIVFPDPAAGDAARVRARLVPMARRVNENLAACGFPLCKGEVMASNPRWCLSLSEWMQVFGGWLDAGSPEALLNAAIFFDFRGLCGAQGLAGELRAWLAQRVRGRTLFLRLLAENALRNGPPLGVLKEFATAEHGGRSGTLDLKINGAALFIDGARVLALALGRSETNTPERLRAAAEAHGKQASEAEAWIEAFHFVQMLRLTHQQRQLAAGQAPDNYLDPERLNALDRRILRESLRQARKLQERLRLDYTL